MLFTFFFVCSKATKYKEDYKRNFDAEFKKGKFNQSLFMYYYYYCFFYKGGQRSSLQVVCNGLFSVLFSALYMVYFGLGEMKIDFNKNYTASFCTIAVLGMNLIKIIILKNLIKTYFHKI